MVIRYSDGSATLDGEAFFVPTDFRKAGIAKLMAGIALAAPLLSSAAVDAAAKSSRAVAADVGITDEFIGEVERLMKPGTSVVFVLDQVQDMDVILTRIRGLGRIVLKTTVDLERAKLIQSTLAASTSDDQRGARN